MMPFVRPPGPTNHGIIGNFPLGSADPLGLYTQWARQYGDIFYYRVFSRHIYFFNNPELIGRVLVTDSNVSLRAKSSSSTAGSLETVS